MSLVQKLILYALAVALLPLAATGFTLIRIGEDALRRRIEQHHQGTVAAVAANVSQGVEELAERIAAVLQQWDPRALTESERRGLLLALYRLSPDISQTLLVNADGDLLCAPVFRSANEDALPGQMGHPDATPEDIERLREYLGGAQAGRLRRGVVLISPAYFHGDGAARVAIAIPSAFGASQEPPTALAGIEIALGKRILHVQGIETGDNAVLFVVDAQGHVIAHPQETAGTDMRDYAPVRALLAQRSKGTARYSTVRGRQAAAFAPIGQLGWGVVVEQKEATAFAAAAAMRQQTLGWIVATVAVVLLSGFLFAGRIRADLQRLVRGARSFSAGELERRISVRSTDEIRELADTMNSMAAELRRSLLQLEEWNQTLELRVTQRTEELQQAQAQLLTQSKLAAIGQLGAGVAHEINNPLTAVMGACQLLLMGKDPESADAKRLRLIDEAAGRCRSIVARMLSLAERRDGGFVLASLGELIDDVAALFQGGLAEVYIELVREMDPDAPAIRIDPAQIELALINLIANARVAMPKGGKLTLRMRACDGGVEIDVEDTGVGIEPEHLPRIFEPFFTTKVEWTAVGLGLSVAYRIVMDHGGRIDARSQVGEGTTFTVFLPRAAPTEKARDRLARARKEMASAASPPLQSGE